MDPGLTSTDSTVSKPSKTSQKEKTYSTKQYGVWELLLMDEGYLESYRRLVHDTPKSLPALYRLTQDIYSCAPTLLVLFGLCQIWVSCQEAVKMHFSSKALRMIEYCLKEGVADFPGVTYFVGLRLAVAVFGSFLSWYSGRVMQKLERRITAHFQIRLLSARLQHDLEQSGNPAAQTSVTAGQAWQAFRELLHFFELVMTVASQLTLIVHLSRSDTGGPLFAFFCFLQPVCSTMFSKSIWSKVCIVRKNNEDQHRIDALSSLVRPEYRQDVISNNLQKFILDEYRGANERLGDMSTESVWDVFSQQTTPSIPMLMTFLGDIPMIFCAILALSNPKHTSFASIAIRQESSTILARYINTILRSSTRFRTSMKQIQDLYEATEGPSEVKTTSDTTTEKPAEVEDATLLAGAGIGFELRNVSFSYPGSQVSKEALRQINLKIKPGQFVVLVGANGSGKSTLLKLLLRLYQPSAKSSEAESKEDTTAGQVLIDSSPALSYTESSLRRSMAVLSQDNLIYPGFSLGENIGLGYTPLLQDDDALNSAATKAGAQSVVERMKDNMSTLLDPLADYYHFNVREQDKDHPLKKILEELRRPTEVSGGEKQRIVAARTFMRFNSGKIRFLAVDEPSSALDAEGEVLLLDNLLKEREGKTIIFVTHRFGKLTRQADLIICMKEGQIVESGTHKELINIPNGEYNKLFNIQASAFRDEDSSSSSITAA